MAAFIFGGSIQVVAGPPVGGLCHMCAVERIQDARMKAVEICDSQSGINRSDNFNAHSPRYELAGRRWRTSGDSGGADRNRRKIEAIGGQVESSLESWARGLDKTLGACGKDRLFDMPDQILDHYGIAQHQDIYKVVRLR
jgi:hypothetical protein